MEEQKANQPTLYPNQTPPGYNYPPSQPPPSWNPGYYPQYPGQYPNQSQQQQGQTTVILQTPVVRTVVPVSRAFYGYRVFTCLVTWFCFFIFGIIAWILAVMARNKAREGQPKEAKNLGIASLVLSVIGRLTGLAVWITFFVFLARCWDMWFYYEPVVYRGSYYYSALTCAGYTNYYNTYIGK